MQASGHAARIGQIYDLTPGVLATSKNAPAPLGSEIIIPASEQDTILGYVLSSTGVLQAGGAKFADSSAYKAAPSNYTVIKNPANMGAQRWVLVANQSGATIERGHAVVWDISNFASNRNSVIVAPTTAHPDAVRGVAQFDIADDDVAYILTEGYGFVIQGDNAAVAGTAFKMDGATAGRTDPTGAATDAAFGVYIEDSGNAGAETEAILQCKR